MRPAPNSPSRPPASRVTGVPGPQGDPGDPGQDGQDGVSPTVTVTDITGGHRITITDATGAHSFDVMDGEGGGVQDVQVNGSSVVQDGVANVPITALGQFGVVKMGYGQSTSWYGLDLDSTGSLRIFRATDSDIKGSWGAYRPIVPDRQHMSVYYGLAKAAGADMANVSGATVGVYPEAQKSAISEMLNSPVSVTGTTPTITALSGIQYVCGEVATLDITLPASGIVDVVFTSGSTPTVLTITPPTGMTVEWANGFDSTALEADTLYELNIKMVGTKCLGVAGAWS